MILLGEANVGKTALVERLTKDTYTGSTGITRGIEITKWNYSNYKVNIWDFGGQEIMRAMHQFFMTERTLYLLLWNSREDDSIGKIEDWLELIKSYGGNSPVILVVSRCDDGNFDPDEHRLKDEYPDNLLAIIRTSAKDGVGVSELKKIIIETIADLNILNEKIPSSWVGVKKEIESISENYINLSEYYSICSKQGVSEVKDQISLLRLLKDLGVAFNYGDKDNPHTTNVLKPEWVTKGIYDIINSNELFQKQGKVTASEIKEILGKSGQYDNKEEVIIGLMKQFELCFSTEEDHLLIPDLLPEKQPYIGSEFEDSLQLQYRYQYMSKSVMPHFIARVHELSRHTTDNGGWYWRSGIIIEREGNKALIRLNARQKTLFIYVIGDKKTRRSFLESIREQLVSLHEGIKGKKPEIIVPVPGSPTFSSSYKSLLQLEREGEKRVFIEDYGYIEIDLMLNGIESPENRKLTADSFRDLFTTEQQRARDAKGLQLRSIRETKVNQLKKLDRVYKKQLKFQDELTVKAEEYAVTKKRNFNFRLILILLALVGISIGLSCVSTSYQWVPITSLVLSALVIGLNTIGVKYSSKYIFEKHKEKKMNELEPNAPFDSQKMTDAKERADILRSSISDIDTQIECV